MTSVNVAMLKEKLSYYLKLVRGGQEVVVTSHRHKIARILPVYRPSPEFTEPERQVKELLKLRGVKPRRSLSAVKALLEDRQRR